MKCSRHGCRRQATLRVEAQIGGHLEDHLYCFAHGRTLCTLIESRWPDAEVTVSAA